MLQGKFKLLMNVLVAGALLGQLLACQERGEGLSHTNGAGSSDSQSGTGTSAGQTTETKALMDPCTLFTKAEVAKHLGVSEAEMQDGVRGPDLSDQGTSECNWDLVNPVEGTDIHVRRLQIVVMQDASIKPELIQNGVTAASQYEIWYQNRDPQYAVDLTDLGDKAFIDVRFNQNFQEYHAPYVYVLKPGYFVKISTSNPMATLTEPELGVSVYAAKMFATLTLERM